MSVNIEWMGSRRNAQQPKVMRGRHQFFLGTISRWYFELSLMPVALDSAWNINRHQEKKSFPMNCKIEEKVNGCSSWVAAEFIFKRILLQMNYHAKIFCYS